MGELNSLTELEKKRYKLQIMLPGIGASGQEKIKNAKVLVIGIGGLGSQALQYLSAMGVGTIGFLDFDTVEEENLSHQVFYGMGDIGKLKAVVTRKRLSEMNPLIQFNMLNIRLNPDNAGSIIPGYDIIVDATNEEDAHLLISDACLKYGKVMVYGSVRRLKGRVSVFNYENGPSFRCSLNLDEDPGSFNEVPLSGMPGILPGVTGSYIANEVVKIITGSAGVLSGQLMEVNVFTYSNTFHEIIRDKSNFEHV